MPGAALVSPPLGSSPLLLYGAPAFAEVPHELGPSDIHTEAMASASSAVYIAEAAVELPSTTS